MVTISQTQNIKQKKPWYKVLYIQVLIAIALGILLGHFSPSTEINGQPVPGWGELMKPMGDAFINLIKMIITPIIFLTVVHGVGSMTDMAKLGRVGGKAFIYFEVVSTFALVIGLIVANVVQPGSGMNIDPKTLDASAISQYTKAAGEMSMLDHFMHIIPKSFLSPFVEGNILQVLLIAILFGVALVQLGEKGKPVLKLIDDLTAVIFNIINMIMKLAPLGAFGAMAFTIGKYGVDSLGNLAFLMVCFYATCALFIFGVLGVIARLAGFNIFSFIKYIKEELLIVIGTSSSESALPALMEKLKKMGCSESVVGLVVPMGYSFNLDGTNIYMTMAALFIAQACGVELTLGQELSILAVALLTSKGATGVTGAGFIVLASTLAVVPTIPVAGMVLILGVDRFMSECRAITNFIGNAVATVVISRWENELDKEKMVETLTFDAVPAAA